MKRLVKPGEALVKLQEDLLLLFLKYKLALRSNVKELEEIPLSEDTFRNILIHSMFHAVFGNTSENDPFLSIRVIKKESYIQFEICSTGEAATYTSGIGTLCHDHFLKNFTSTNFSAFDEPALAAVNVQAKPPHGSKISFIFLPD